MNGSGPMFNPENSPESSGNPLNNSWKEEAYTVIKKENEYLKEQMAFMRALIEKVMNLEVGKLIDFSELAVERMMFPGTAEGSNYAKRA